MGTSTVCEVCEKDPSEKEREKEMELEMKRRSSRLSRLGSMDWRRAGERVPGGETKDRRQSRVGVEEAKWDGGIRTGMKGLKAL